jgi:WD40 repeat protein
LIFNRF